MINKVILVGNLGGDPEVKHTQGGTTVANFNVATTERWKDRDGQMQEQTEWHRVVAWGKLADICGEYLRKGSKVYVEGSSKTRKWQDQNGIDRYTTEVHIREMKMLDPKRAQGTGSGTGQGPGNSYQPPASSMGEDIPF